MLGCCNSNEVVRMGERGRVSERGREREREREGDTHRDKQKDREANCCIVIDASAVAFPVDLSERKMSVGRREERAADPPPLVQRQA